MERGVYAASSSQIRSRLTTRGLELLRTVKRRERRAPAAFLGFLLLGAGALCGSGTPTNPAGKSATGFTYFHDEVRAVPWSIHVVKMERARTDLELHTTLGRGACLGMDVVSEQARSVPARLGKPLAAINGGFYRRSAYYPGVPEGLQIVDGELISEATPSRTCLWIDGNGNFHRTNVSSQFKITWPDGTSTPLGLNAYRENDDAMLYTSVIGRSTRTFGGVEVVVERTGDAPWLPLRIGETYTAQVRSVRDGGNTPLKNDVLVLSLGPRISPAPPKLAAGAVVKISTATTPDLKGAKTAICGGPTLVQGGQIVQWNGFQMRNPRTAVGWNKDYFFMVEVDGRQRGLSIGMTLPELAAYMVKLGCDEAINFDGGGSATMWVLGNVINSPSEGQERPGANALVLVRKPPK